MKNKKLRSALLDSSNSLVIPGDDNQPTIQSLTIRVDNNGANAPKNYLYYKDILNSRSIKKIFKKPKQGNLTIFEEILTTNEDNSAVISLILRKFEDDNFWTNEMLGKVMNHYIKDHVTNDKNLFSILMYDWHEWDKNPKRKYFLFEKFETFKKLTLGNKTLFEKIFQIVVDETKKECHQICVKIIYYYFHEMTDCVTKNGDLQSIVIKALQMTDNEYKNDILKILLAHVITINEEDYQALKFQILNAVNYETENYHSSLKSSYKSMTKLCDKKFFELVFLLKENSLLQFKVEYKEFIAMHKKYFGEYWTTAMRLHNQILYLLTKYHNLIDIREFLLIESADPEIKSFITYFQKVAEFQALFNEPLDAKSEKLLTKLLNFMNDEFVTNGVNLEGFKTLFKNTPEIRRVFFGRKHLNGKSIFEQILSTIQFNDFDFKNQFQKVLNYVWDEFLLKDKPEILTLKNYQGKRLIDHVLNTTCDFLFTAFLATGKPNYFEEKRESALYMILKNSLYYDYKTDENDKCLVEFHMKLIDKNVGDDHKNLKNLLYLFEEISQYNPEQTKNNTFAENLLAKITNEISETFNELKLPRKHFLLGFIMLYFNYFMEFQEIQNDEIARPSRSLVKKFRISIRSSANKSNEILNCETSFIPFLKILSLIVTSEEEEVLDVFSHEIVAMEKLYKEVYQFPNIYDSFYENHECHYEKYPSSFCFILLYAAIKTNQKNIVKKIFEFNNFLINIPEFPPNMIATEIHNYTALRFLEKKYELACGDLPRTWITGEVFEKFLDSRISYQNGFYKIDCNFMVPYSKQESKLTDLTDENIMNEDYETMEYILNHQDLKNLLTHPVMEMIIRIKLQKFSLIFLWNFILFITTYVVPTSLLIQYFHTGNSTNSSLEHRNIEVYSDTGMHEFIYDVILPHATLFFLLFIRFPFLIVRIFYTKGMSRYVELGLLLLTIIHVILAIFNEYKPEDFVQNKEYLSQILFLAFVITEVSLIMFMIISIGLFDLFPLLNFSMYMKCFNRVLATYCNVFLIFMPLFIGCTTLMFIIFDKNLDGKVDAFNTFGMGFVKYIMMVSGEIDIKISDLSGCIQGLAFIVVIILVITQTNMILSLVIDDVRNVMNRSRMYILTAIAERYVELAKHYRNFYLSYMQCQIGKSIRFKLRKILVSKHPYVHQLQTFYIEKDTGNIYADINKSAYEFDVSDSQCVRIVQSNIVRRKIASYWENISGDFIINEEILEKIREIELRVKVDT